MKKHTRGSEKVEYGDYNARGFGYGADDAAGFGYGAGNAGGFRYAYRTTFSDSFHKIFSEVHCPIMFTSFIVAPFVSRLSDTDTTFDSLQIFEDETHQFASDIQVNLLHPIQCLFPTDSIFFNHQCLRHILKFHRWIYFSLFLKLLKDAQRTYLLMHMFRVILVVSKTCFFLDSYSI